MTEKTCGEVGADKKSKDEENTDGAKGTNTGGGYEKKEKKMEQAAGKTERTTETAIETNELQMAVEKKDCSAVHRGEEES